MDFRPKIPIFGQKSAITGKNHRKRSLIPETFSRRSGTRVILLSHGGFHTLKSYYHIWKPIPTVVLHKEMNIPYLEKWYHYTVTSFRTSNQNKLLTTFALFSIFKQNNPETGRHFSSNYKRQRKRMSWSIQVRGKGILGAPKLSVSEEYQESESAAETLRWQRKFRASEQFKCAEVKDYVWCPNENGDFHKTGDVGNEGLEINFLKQTHI